MQSVPDTPPVAQPEPVSVQAQAPVEPTSADFGIADPLIRPAVDRNAPAVFMQALRVHTYHGRVQDVDDVYLCREDEVENIENLRFARRVPPPLRAVRPR